MAMHWNFTNTFAHNTQRHGPTWRTSSHRAVTSRGLSRHGASRAAADLADGLQLGELVGCFGRVGGVLLRRRGSLRVVRRVRQRVDVIPHAPQRSLCLYPVSATIERPVQQ